MFQRPAANVTTRPAAASASGTQTIIVSDELRRRPERALQDEAERLASAASPTRQHEHGDVDGDREQNSTTPTAATPDAGGDGQRSRATLTAASPGRACRAASDEMAELVEVGRRRVELVEDPPGEEHEDAVAVAQQLVEVGRGEDDRRAVPATRQQLRPDPVRRVDVQSAGGMLHQQEAQLVGQHREQQALLVAAGQRLDGRVVGRP